MLLILIESFLLKHNADIVAPKIFICKSEPNKCSLIKIFLMFLIGIVSISTPIRYQFLFFTVIISKSVSKITIQGVRISSNFRLKIRDRTVDDALYFKILNLLKI